MNRSTESLINLQLCTFIVQGTSCVIQSDVHGVPALKLHQLSVFIENKPGQLLMPCQVLAQAGINIVTLSLADTQQFGIMRLIVRDWVKAKTVLEQAGCVVRMTEVVALEVEDEPGGLAKVLTAIDKAGLNVEYMYAFAIRQGDKAVLIFRFEDAEAAIRKLSEAHMPVISAVALFDRHCAC